MGRRTEWIGATHLPQHPTCISFHLLSDMHAGGYVRTRGWEEATIPCRPSTGLRRDVKGILPSSRHMMLLTLLLLLLPIKRV